MLTWPRVNRMEEESDDWRRITWSKDLDDIEVIGTEMFSVGVPVDADPELKTHVFVAGVTHSGELSRLSLGSRLGFEQTGGHGVQRREPIVGSRHFGRCAARTHTLVLRCDCRVPARSVISAARSKW